MTAHVSDLSWSKYASQELSWAERWRLRRHLRVCDSCQESRRRLDQEKTAWDADPRRATEVAHLVGRIGPEARRPARWQALVLSAAAACAAVSLVVLWPHHRLTPKGGDVFVAYVKRGGTVTILGDRCAPGDLLRFHYETEHPYLTIVERDATGELSILVPPDGRASTPLESPKGETAGSWQLDAATGTEHFFGVFADKPLSREELLAAFSNGAGAPRLPDASVSVLSCRKERP
jgi:hypothetical protein